MTRKEIEQALKRLEHLREQKLIGEAEFRKENTALHMRLQSLEEGVGRANKGIEINPKNIQGQDIFTTGGATLPASRHESEKRQHQKEALWQKSNPPSEEGVDFFVTGGASPGTNSPLIPQEKEHPSQQELQASQKEAADIFATGGGSAPGEELAPQEEVTILARRYQLKGSLGQGGMGQVFQAMDLQTREKVALKILHQEGSKEEQRRRFLQELQLHERLVHPNIVPAHSLEHDPRVGFFFTMDFVAGEDLAQCLARAKQEQTLLPIDRSLHILAGIAAGLEHAHQQGVLHLDLKPANILLEDEKVKLIDFGIARMRSQTSAQTPSGTVYYMAPEQLSGEGPLTPAADVYALGIIAYQLLTGTLFQGGFPGPSQLNSALPVAVDEVHDKAVFWKEEGRFQRATEFVSALRRALQMPTKTAPESQSLIHEGRSPQAPSHQLIHTGRDPKAPETPKRTPKLTSWLQSHQTHRQEAIERKRPTWLPPLLAPKIPPLCSADALSDLQLYRLPVPPLSPNSLYLISHETPLLEFVDVQGGKFWVGADKKERQARRHEKPQTQLQLSTFWIARTPITNLAWISFRHEAGYLPDAQNQHPDYLRHWSSQRMDEQQDDPLVYISLLDAWAFCDYYGLSLPSEAQWEAAARGVEKTPTAAGDSDPSTTTEAPIPHSNAKKLRPVGASPHRAANDLLGCLTQTRQWVADEFDTRWLRQLREVDPVIQGQERARFCTLRGSSFSLPTEQAYVFRRDSESPDACLEDISFRPCLDLPHKWEGPS